MHFTGRNREHFSDELHWEMPFQIDEECANDLKHKKYETQQNSKILK